MASGTANPKGLTRRILTLLAVALGILVLLVVLGIWIMLGTASGRTWLVDRVMGVVNRSENVQVIMEDLSWPSIGHMELGALSVRTNDELRVQVTDVELDWRPRALFGKKLEVNQLTLASLHFYQPQSPAEDEEPETAETETSEASFDLESTNLPEILVSHFELEEFRFVPSSDELGPSGIPDIHLSGSLQRLNDVPFNAQLTASIRSDNNELDVEPDTRVQLEISEAESTWYLVGSIDERAGGYLGTQLKLPEEQSLDADIRAHLSFGSEQIEVLLESLSLPIAGRSLGAEGQMQFTPDFSNLAIPAFVLRIDQDENQLSGLLQDENLNFDLSINAFPIDMLSDLGLLTFEQASLDQGLLNAQVAITGTLDAPVAKARATIDATLNGSATQLALDTVAGKEEIVVNQLELIWGEAELNASGALSLASSDSAFEFQASNLSSDQLVPFGVAIPDGLQARLVSAEGRIGGNLKDPDADFEANLTGSYNTQSFEIQAIAGKRAQLVLIEQLQIGVPDGETSLSGEIDLDSLTGDLDFTASGLGLELAEIAGISMPPGLVARLSTADGKISGNLKDPDAEFEAVLVGTYKTQAFEFQASGSKTAQQILIEHFDLDVQDGKTTASGTVNLGTLSGDFSINAEALSIELAELAGVEIPPELTGYLSGTASVTGEMKNPEVQTNLLLQGNYADLPYSAVAEATRSGQLININALRISARNNDVLNIQGSVDETRVDLRLLANQLPTDILSAFGVDINSGDFNADLSVLGPITQPELRGFLNYRVDALGAGTIDVQEDTEFEWQLQADTAENHYILKSTSSSAPLLPVS